MAPMCSGLPALAVDATAPLAVVLAVAVSSTPTTVFFFILLLLSMGSNSVPPLSQVVWTMSTSQGACLATSLAIEPRARVTP